MPVSEILKLAYSIDWSTQTFLECGAYRDGSETADFNESINKWYIEGNPDDFGILKSKHKNCLNVLLSDINGEQTFNVTSLGGNSSINHLEGHKKELKNINATISQITVKSITYSYLITEIIKHKINILVLDIEGHEVNVLQTFKKLYLNEYPEVIVIECGYNWEERLKLLHILGYEEDFYFYNNCYLTHKDAKIIKNKSNIDSFNKQWPQFIWSDTLIYRNTTKFYDSNI